MSGHPPERTPGRWHVWSDPGNNPDDGSYWCYAFRAARDQRTFSEHEVNAAIMTAASQMLDLLRDIQLAGALKGQSFRARLDRLLTKLDYDDKR